MRRIVPPSLAALAVLISASAASSEPVRPFRDCDDCPEMVAIPAGRFLMGSPSDEAGRRENEGPVREVAIRAFAIGRYEVTVAEFTRFARETGHGWPGDCLKTFVQDATHPAVCVNWRDAAAFVAWLARRTGRAYRLPSEAEWEYAARAGTATAYHFGATITPEQANFDGKGGYATARIGIFRAGTMPVGSFPPNGFGLHDVHGNVWEWAEDCYSPSHDGAAADGSARRDGDCTRRAMRGGPWNYGPDQIRSAYRVQSGTEHRSHGNGLRVARSLD